jgi:hypothetical protein
LKWPISCQRSLHEKRAEIESRRSVLRATTTSAAAGRAMGALCDTVAIMQTSVGRATMWCQRRQCGRKALAKKLIPRTKLTAKFLSRKANWRANFHPLLSPRGCAPQEDDVTSDASTSVNGGNVCCGQAWQPAVTAVDANYNVGGGSMPPALEVTIRENAVARIKDHGITPINSTTIAAEL